MKQKPASTEGQSSEQTASLATSDDAACYACLYCGSTDYTVDLNGMARVIVCGGCETRVPIAVMENKGLRANLYHDDIRELLERMKDDLGEISPEIGASLTRHATAIMDENASEQSLHNV